MELTRTRTGGRHLDNVVYGCGAIQYGIVHRILLGKRPAAGQALAALAIVPGAGARQADEERDAHNDAHQLPAAQVA